MKSEKRVARTLNQDVVSATRSLRRVAGVLARLEPGILAVIYALFVASDRVPAWGLAAIGLLWLARWWVTGRLATRTPMDVPILLILAMVPVGLYASVDWALSLPKVYGILLGIAVFYAVANGIETVRGVWLVTFLLVLTGAANALLGLVGTDWVAGKLFALPWVYGRLPQLIRGVPRSIRGGFSHNAIGGTLIFLIPVLASLLWARRELTSVLNDRRAYRAPTLNRWFPCAAAISLLLMMFTLLMTQSRGSFFGVAVGLLALSAWRDRRFLWTIPAVALGLFASVQLGAGGKLAEFVLRMDTVGGGVTGTMQSRMEVWQRAIYMIQGFPYTGIGIATFDPVVHTMYPLFLAGPDATVIHAHNELLQVVVDLGIPGLVAYVGLLSAFAVSAWRAYRALNDRWLRALIMGLACGMLAHQVFGLTDAFQLGTKPGVVMWVFLGIMAALYVHRDRLARQLSGDVAGSEGEEGSGASSADDEHKAGGRQTLSRLGNLLLAFGYWALFSLLAIAFISDWPYLGLAIALAGGVVLGFLCMRRFEPKIQEGPNGTDGPGSAI